MPKYAPNSPTLLSTLLPWMRPYAGTFLVAVSLLLFSSGAKMLGPIILQQAIDKYILPGNFQGLSLLLGGYVLLVVTGFAAHYWQLIQLETAGLQIIATVKKAAFRHLVNLDLPFFDKNTTGKLVSRIENDANAMKILFSSVMSNVVSNLLMMVGMFLIMSWQYDLKLAIYVVGICPIILGAGILFQRLMRPLLLSIREKVAEVNGLLTEVIQGIGTIQMFEQQDRFMDRIEVSSSSKNRLEGFMTIGFNSFFNVLFFVQNLALAMVLWFGGNLVMEQQLSVGSLVLFMVFIRTFFGPIMFLSSQFNEFQKAVAGGHRIFDLLQQTAQVKSPLLPIEMPSGLWDIEFKNVYFRYPGSENWTLENVSFHCKAGEHWALVGSTGSGKTTIISLLLRFYDPQQGEILVNGVNIQHLNLQDVRAGVGLVLQDVIFFPGTLWQNLVLDASETELSRDKVRKTLQTIGLDQLIQGLPNGYDTELEEGAHNLSEGEQQLLSFGRALLRNPQVLVLDEATSHVDPETESKIQSAMHSVLRGRTALMIAHRLSTIEATDAILVLDKGKVIEVGSHQTLLNKRGHYAQLHALQVQHV